MTIKLTTIHLVEGVLFLFKTLPKIIILLMLSILLVLIVIGTITIHIIFENLIIIKLSFILIL